MDPLGSFTEFMVAKYPNVCPMCLGAKKLQFIGPATRQLCVVTCHECGGTGEKDEPRASVMPSHLPSIDPYFHNAAMRSFEPETPGEREALLERMGVVLYGRGR